MKRWYLRSESNTVGPVSIDQLKEMAGKGEIRQHSQVGLGPNGPWKQASEVPMLSDCIANSSLATQTQKPSPAQTQIKSKSALPKPPPLPASSKQDRRATKKRVLDLQTHTKPPKDLESILWSGRPSVLPNLPSLVVWCVVWLLVLGLIAGLDDSVKVQSRVLWTVLIVSSMPVFVSITKMIRIRAIGYELSTERLGVKCGFFARDFDSMELYRIKDSRVSQSLMQRVFGLSSLILVSSDRITPTVCLASIDHEDALFIREEIRQLSETLRQKKGVREVDYA